MELFFHDPAYAFIPTDARQVNIHDTISGCNRLSCCNASSALRSLQNFKTISPFMMAASPLRMSSRSSTMQTSDHLRVLKLLNSKILFLFHHLPSPKGRVTIIVVPELLRIFNCAFISITRRCILLRPFPNSCCLFVRYTIPFPLSHYFELYTRYAH
jgi:hypothetical protein